MRRFIVRAYVAVAAGVVLGTVGVTGASASAAAPRTLGVSSGGTSHAPPSPGAQLWLKRYDGPTGSSNYASSVAVSPTGGQVFVTGDSYASSVNGYATVAYSAATGAQLWVMRYHGNGTDSEASSVAVSPTGSTVFVTGYSAGATAGVYYATVAYNATTGAQLWVKRYNPSGNGVDEATSVAISPSGSTVFVTGFAYGPSAPHYATVAYNAATGAQLWVKLYHGSGNQGTPNQGAASVAVSPSGNTVFVTGQGATSDLPDYATIAYNAATGAQLWVKLYSYPGLSSQATSVAVSPSGKTVYVTGDYAGTKTGYATVAYNAATGAQLWVKGYSPFGGGGSDDAYSVAVSPSGSTVFVTGGIYGGGGEGDEDYGTVAYNAATGVQLWVKRYNPNGGTNYAYSVAVSPSGSTVYVTGGSGRGYATVAYNAATGAQLWLKRYNGTLFYTNPPPAARLVAVSPTTGTVFVTGYIIPVGGRSYDYATIAYSG